MRRIQLKRYHNIVTGRKVDAELGPKTTTMGSNREKVRAMCERR